VTIRNCVGTGQNPGVSGKAPGRFLRAENFDNVDVSNNTFTGTSGIYLLNYAGGGAAGKTVRVVNNTVRNIDGRYSTGSGWSTTGFLRVQFLQLDKVRHIQGGLVAWNDVINTPNQSRVEDNINVYLSSGTASSPLMIRDNLIRGAYGAAAATETGYSGGGILVGDGNVSSAADSASYVTATGNTVIDTTNYGIAMAAGHHLSLTNNRVISDGKLADGSTVASQNIGMYVWNMNGDPNWGSNSATGNAISWMKAGKHNDWWTPDCGTGCSGNSLIQGTIDAAAENAEESRWRQRVSSGGIAIGSTLA
jgi:hypothetical protein